MQRIKKERSLLEFGWFLLILTTILILLASVGYSALSTNLLISGEVHIRVPADIRITNISLLESTSQGYETYNSEYYKDGVKIFTTLPNINSTVTHQVEVKNTSELQYVLLEINDLISSNEYMTYDIENIDLYDVVNGGETITFNITVKYKADVKEVPINNTNVLEIVFEFIEKEETPPILTIKKDMVIVELH